MCGEHRNLPTLLGMVRPGLLLIILYDGKFEGCAQILDTLAVGPIDPPDPHRQLSRTPPTNATSLVVGRNGVMVVRHWIGIIVIERW